MERRARPRAPPDAMTSPMEGVDRPTGPRRKKGASRHRSEGIFLRPKLRDLQVWSSVGLTGGQRRRLLRDVNEACRALNWMHGEESRPTALPPSLVASEDRNNVFVPDVQQRVILAALRWLDADSAVDEHEALAKLLMGRTSRALGVSFNVGSYEHSRISLPDSLVWTHRH